MKGIFKKALLTGFICTLSGLMSFSAQARGERKGFMVGGNALVGGEVADLDIFAGGIGLRIGAGLSDKLLLYYEGETLIGSKYGTTAAVGTSLAKAQYFFTDHIYANAGVGLGILSFEADGERASKAGFGMNVGAGYEFRITERFVISPELSLTYAHVSRFDLFAPAAKAFFGVYF